MEKNSVRNVIEYFAVKLDGMGWTIKKCRIAFSASSRLPTKEFFLQWKL